MRLVIAIGAAAIAWIAAYVFVGRLSARIRPVALTTATGLILVALNSYNMCAPGWCGWYGFPLHYYTWSDSMGNFNGFRFGYPSFHPVAAFVDVSVIITVCMAVFRQGQRALRGGEVV